MTSSADIVRKYESLIELKDVKFDEFSEKKQKPVLAEVQKCGLVHLLNVVCSSCAKQIVKYGKAVLPDKQENNNNDDDDEKKEKDNFVGQYFSPAGERIENEEDGFGVNLCLECKTNVECGLPLGNGNIEAYAKYCAEKIRMSLKCENDSAMYDGIALLIHATSCSRADGLWTNERGFLSLIAKDLRASKIQVEQRQNELAVSKASCLCGEAACTHEFVVKLFTPYSQPASSSYSRSNPPIMMRISASKKQLNEETTEKRLIEQHNKETAVANEKQEALEQEIMVALQFRAAMRRAYFNVAESEVSSRALSLFHICRSSFDKESRLRPAFQSYVELAGKKKKRADHTEHVVISEMDDIYLVKEDTKSFEIEGYGEVYKWMSQCMEPSADEETAYRGLPAEHLEQFKTIRNWEFVRDMVNRDGYAWFVYRRLQDGDMRKKKSKK